MPSAATSLGTPRAESWDKAWMAFVDETEERLGRPNLRRARPRNPTRLSHGLDGSIPWQFGMTQKKGKSKNYAYRKD